jgi:hypothetical protein
MLTSKCLSSSRLSMSQLRRKARPQRRGRIAGECVVNRVHGVNAAVPASPFARGSPCRPASHCPHQQVRFCNVIAEVQRADPSASVRSSLQTVPQRIAGGSKTFDFGVCVFIPQAYAFRCIAQPKISALIFLRPALPVNDLIPDTRLIADKMETGQDTSPATSVRGPPLSLTPRRARFRAADSGQFRQVLNGQMSELGQTLQEPDRGA